MPGDTLGVKSIDPNIDVPNLLSGTGCASPINPGNSNHYIKTQCFGVPNPINLRGNLGRNTLIGPGLINLDSSVFKNNRIKSISDRFNIQFRSEFFNHTYSTLLHDLGTPVKVQQTLLGHSSASTTMDVYTHPVSESERDAVAKLGRVLFPNVPNLHQNAAGSETARMLTQ